MIRIWRHSFRWREEDHCTYLKHFLKQKLLLSILWKNTVVVCHIFSVWLMGGAYLKFRKPMQVKQYPKGLFSGIFRKLWNISFSPSCSSPLIVSSWSKDLFSHIWASARAISSLIIESYNCTYSAAKPPMNFPLFFAHTMPIPVAIALCSV